jgi:hypothetical protein
MTRSARDPLRDLPPKLPRRECMLQVEAVIFASAEPVSRETLGGGPVSSERLGQQCARIAAVS